MLITFVRPPILEFGFREPWARRVCGCKRMWYAGGFGVVGGVVEVVAVLWIIVGDLS